MNKKEYIEKLVNLIVNKVKFHAPNLIDDNVDFALLDAVGIDATYPIFIFKKPLDKLFFTAFLQAKKMVKFNLILSQKPLVSNRKISKMEMTKVILEQEMGSMLLSTLDALNINYLSHSNFEKELQGEYVKFNNKQITMDYCPYYYNKKIMDNGIIFEAKEFLLNGKNYCLNLINSQSEAKSATIDINIPLPRGYYVFKKGFDYVEICNLCSREKGYFNFHLKGAKFNFSTLNGLESSTFSCINLKAEIKLLPKQKRMIFFNFGQEKFNLYSAREILNFFELSQVKMNENFDLKVTTHDKNFERLFNYDLPRKIWEKWQKNDTDEKSENEWLKLKNKIIFKCDNGEQIREDFKGLKEVKIYRNSRWKRVFILHNGMTYLFVDNVKYFNFSLLTKEILLQNNEIYLSFAS